MARKVDFKVDMLEDVKTVWKNMKAEQKKKMGLVMRDMRRDVPAVVANAVHNKYNIKTSEIKPPAVSVKVDKDGNKIKVKKAASVRVDGEDLESMAVTYRGRRLTVQRFSMTPKKPVKFTGRTGRKTRAKTPVQATIQKGKRTNIKYSGRRTFVQNVRGVNQALYAKDGSREIEMVAKTLSVPIMVDNKAVRKEINKGINERIEKSLKKWMSD